MAVPDTGTAMPTGDGGAVELIANAFLQAGSFTLAVGEACPGGDVTGPGNAERMTWSVNLIAR